VVASALGFGSVLDPHALFGVGRVRLDDRFGVEVPAFAALCRAQRLGPVSARRTDRRERMTARHQDLRDAAGIQVGAAQLDRPDAAAVLDGQVLDHIAGQRHGQAFHSGSAYGHSASEVSGSGSVMCQVAR
jgi:hypothetical protein